MIGLNRKVVSHFDWPLLGCTVVIVAVGLMNLFSATYTLSVARYFRQQCMWVSAGLVLALILTLFDYRVLERLVYPFFVLAVLLLVLVMFKGKTALGAQRWIALGPLSLQPSELAKLAMVLVLAHLYGHRKDVLALDFGRLFIPAALAATLFVLILKQPDLGTALIVAAIAAAMTLFVGVRRRVLVTVGVIVLVTTPLAWRYVLRPYQKERVITFVNPEADPLDKGYQIIQSKIAIGSGELVGKGYLRGTQSKLQFLPKQHTDFVFSNFAEEFGFVGAIFLLALYASFCFLGINVAYAAKDHFGRMLALGVTAMIASQVVINLGMVMGLLPVVGVPLPMLSYGGTSMIATLIGVGLLLNISGRRYIF